MLDLIHIKNGNKSYVGHLRIFLVLYLIKPEAKMMSYFQTIIPFLVSHGWITFTIIILCFVFLVPRSIVCVMSNSLVLKVLILKLELQLTDSNCDVNFTFKCKSKEFLLFCCSRIVVLFEWIGVIPYTYTFPPPFKNYRPWPHYKPSKRAPQTPLGKDTQLCSKRDEVLMCMDGG